MIIQQKIEELGSLIIKKIQPLITNDYVYLDLPYYSNIGDSLIWKGTEDFLKNLPYNCLYRCAFNTCQIPNIDKSVIILLHGGGNFGNLYRAHCKFRNSIIERYPDNRIIILPQTVYYDDYRYVRHDASIMCKHKNLHICARDFYSYEFLTNNKFGKNIMLVPDMAFCMESNYLTNQVLPSESRNLLFQRIDKEKTDLASISKNIGVEITDVKDWPYYNVDEPRILVLNNLIRDGKFEEANMYAINTYLPERVADGIRMISVYENVYSNRLHGAILSILLGKSVSIIDNSYGKNKQFYDTWLSDVDGVSFIDVPHPTNIKRTLKSIASRLPFFKCPESRI